MIEVINNEDISSIIEKYFNIKAPFNIYSKTIVYKDDNIIKGILVYDEIYERIEIDYILVLDEYRKQGIGSKLLDYFDKNISLEVRESNIVAIEFYKKNGFTVVARREKYYNGEDALLMCRGVNMKDVYILAIESSCDETSCSIIKNGCDEISTVVLTQMDIHALYGGVVPEIASRNHIENITIVIEETLNKVGMKMEEIDAIAVTYGPGLIGSLLIGVNAAKTLAYMYNKPLVPVHHIAGHIYANNLVKPLTFPLIALVVSGGHTDLIYMKEDYSFERIGGTLDDAVGEAYDKVARVLGVPYPGGPLIDQMAHNGKNTYTLPIPLNDNSYNFSFSGLKSAVINLVHNEGQRGNVIRKNDLACSFQSDVVDILTKKTMKALKEYNVKNLIVAGGVSANKGLREKLSSLCYENNINLTVPEMKYCTDNAAMIGAAGYYAYKLGRRADLDLNAKATTELK